MSFAARLVHAVTIVRSTYDDTDPDDEYGQPSATVTEIATRALIQPKSAREQVDTRSAGAQIADHTIFLLPQLLYPSDQFVDSGGQSYKITGIRSFEYGRTPHIEVDALAVQRATDNQVAVGS